MAEYPVLHTQPRGVTGKKVKALRRDGLTPIVVYGPSTETVALQTDTKELIRVLGIAAGTQLIAIEVEGEDEPRMALARDVQRHVTKLTPLHADFLEVDVTKKLVSEVPVVVEGDPTLVRQAEAILLTPMTAVMVEALPTDLPSAIVIDSAVFKEMDDAVYVSDLTVEGDVVILDDPEELVARLAPSRLAQAQLELEEEAAEELEVAEIEELEEVPEAEAPAEEPEPEAEPESEPEE